MITIYGTTTCSYCKKAVELAKNRNLQYTYKIVDEDHSAYDEMKMRVPQAKTVPQIFWDERYIGGYTQFAQEVENVSGGYGDGKI